MLLFWSLCLLFDCPKASQLARAFAKQSSVYSHYTLAKLYFHENSTYAPRHKDAKQSPLSYVCSKNPQNRHIFAVVISWFSSSRLHISAINFHKSATPRSSSGLPDLALSAHQWCSTKCCITCLVNRKPESLYCRMVVNLGPASIFCQKRFLWRSSRHVSAKIYYLVLLFL